ncbi:ParA family protein [Heliomicrobium modesticaldum]|uniref:ParA family protein n=1 Tax=Heliomicrobium modesticaldum TaxID=35701 RepID=UPI001930D94C|nr:ParA family protein [Heliomicrobium modesticaldum]
MGTVVSMINMKGGVGKTNLAFQLAWFSAYKRNFKVLVVDLDPQSNSSHCLMGAKTYMEFIENGGITVYDIFEQYSTPNAKVLKKHEAIYKLHAWNDGSLIHLIPSRLELYWTLKNPTGKDHLLKKYLDALKNDYDLIIIDCAPTESILTTSAYHATDFILIPVKPEFLAAIGLPLLVKSLLYYNTSYGQQHFEIAGIVFNDADASQSKPEHNLSRKQVTTLAEEHGWHVFENEVRHSDSYPKSCRETTPIFHTKHSREYVIDEFINFGNEFLERIGI